MKKNNYFDITVWLTTLFHFFSLGGSLIMLQNQIRICTRLCHKRLLTTGTGLRFQVPNRTKYSNNKNGKITDFSSPVSPLRKTIDDKNNSNKLWTIPNIITMSRILTTPFIGFFIYNSQLNYALGLFTYSCLTDFIDGYIARRFNLKSSFGSILDPIADKLLMIVTTLSMSLPMGPHIIPMPVASIILGRDVILGLTGIFVRYTTLINKYAEFTWSSYWNMTQYPTVEVKPTRISKWNTFFQMVYLGMSGVIFLMEDSKEKSEAIKQEDKKNKLQMYWRQGFSWLGYFVSLTTICSGLSYWNAQKAIKLIKK